MKALWIKAAAAAALAAALAMPAAAQESALLNGSFEDAEPDAALNPHNDVAAHWGRWGNWMNRETLWTPTHGESCMMGYHHWRISETNMSGFYQDLVNVAPTTRCTFTVYAYVDRDTNAEKVELRIEQAGGFRILSSRVFTMASLKTAAWQPLTIVGTNDMQGVRVLVAVKPLTAGARKGAIKFDDASLVLEHLAGQLSPGVLP